VVESPDEQLLGSVAPLFADWHPAGWAEQRASLVEQERANIFTTSVANVPPGAAITVEIEYQHALRYDSGQFRLRFPMVVGPRYIPGSPPDTDRVPDASRITPPVAHPARGPINPVRLVIELDPGAPPALLESPYHEIQTTPLAGGRYRIDLAGTVPADRDFELVWTIAPGAAPQATLFTENVAGAIGLRASHFIGADTDTVLRELDVR
jgi:Ca-activated chloride channel family protein